MVVSELFSNIEFNIRISKGEPTRSTVGQCVIYFCHGCLMCCLCSSTCAVLLGITMNMKSEFLLAHYNVGSS